MSARIRARGRESGASAVELALILPVLVLLLFGTMQYGFYFWARSSDAAAAREGSRRAVVGDLATCAALRTFVAAEVGAAKGGNPVSVTRSYAPGPRNTTPTKVQVGDIMTVEVAFKSLDIGLIPLPLGGVVTARAISRVENVTTAPEPCS